MAEKNSMTCTPALKEKLLLHFTLAYKYRDERFGNARLARNTFETMLTNQASRLAQSSDFSSDALATLHDYDLLSEFEEEIQRLKATGADQT